MPNYNYTCKSCDNVQVEFRYMNDRNKKTKCVKCGGVSEHTISIPSLILTSPEDRWANDHEVNGNGIRANM